MLISVAIPTILTLDKISALIDHIKKQARGKIEVVVSSSDGSTAYNRNRCLDQAKGDIIIMVDDDIENIPEGFDLTIAEYLKNKKTLIVGARLMNVDGTVQKTSTFNMDTKPEFVEVKTIPGAFIGFRKTDLMFDENFRAWGYEDTDFCKQLLNENPEGRFIVVNGLQVTHRNEEKRKNVAVAENGQYFFQKWNKRKNNTV